MDGYRIAEVCPNGHVSTSSADEFPELREPFCSKCGEATMTHCPNCKVGIRGHYNVDGYSSNAEYTPPAFCFNCGNPFEWTRRRIGSAVELVEIDGHLTPAEVAQFRSDVTDLTVDGPKTIVASVRFKRIMSKVGGPIAEGVRKIIVEVLSEAAKKAIWGPGA
jgi:hypothetical protein